MTIAALSAVFVVGFLVGAFASRIDRRQRFALEYLRRPEMDVGSFNALYEALGRFRNCRDRHLVLTKIPLETRLTLAQLRTLSSLCFCRHCDDGKPSCSFIKDLYQSFFSIEVAADEIHRGIATAEMNAAERLLSE